MSLESDIIGNSEELAQLDAMLSQVIGDSLNSNGLEFLHDQMRIGKYLVTGPMGSGGQAYCLRALDEDLNRDVVLKLYSDDLSQIQREQILREGRALAKVKNPRVAQCYGVETFEDRPYLVLEYVKGEPLDKWAADRNVYPKQAMQIVAKIIAALESVHAAGLLHLDLKPGNVIINEDEEIVLIDFGISKHELEPASSGVSGTMSFLPPEALDGKIDQRSDIFGVGGILYYLLTKRAPFEGDSKSKLLNQISQEGVDFGPLEANGITTQAHEICQRCLAQNPDERYQNVASLKSAMHKTGSWNFAIATSLVSVAALVGIAVLLTNTLVQNNPPKDVSRNGVGNIESAEAPLSQVTAGTNTKHEVSLDTNRRQIIDRVLFGNTAEFKNDFLVDYHLSLKNKIITSWNSNTSSDVLLTLSLGAKHQLQITPKENCYFSLFSFEQKPDSQQINHVKSIHNLGRDQLRLAGTLWTFPLEADTPTPDGGTEYLWIVATSEPFKNRSQFLSQLNSELSKGSERGNLLVENNRTRGLRSDSDQQQLVSETLIPYVAIEPVKQAMSTRGTSAVREVATAHGEGHPAESTSGNSNAQDTDNRKKSVASWMAEGNFETAKQRLKEKLGALEINEDTLATRNCILLWLAHLTESDGNFGDAEKYWKTIVLTRGNEDRDSVDQFVKTCQQQLELDDESQKQLVGAHRKFIQGQSARNGDMLYEAYKVYRSLLGPDNVYTNVTMLQLARATRNFTNKQQEEILQAVEWFATNSKFSALYQADLEFVKVAPLMVTNANDVMTKALGHLESAESTYRCCREFDDFRWVAMRLDQCYFETVRKNLGQVRQWLVETETMLQSNELSPRHQFIFHTRLALLEFRSRRIQLVAPELERAIKIVQEVPSLEQSDTDQVMFALIGLTQSLPETNYKSAIEYSSMAIRIKREKSKDPKEVERDIPELIAYRGRAHFAARNYAEAINDLEIGVRAIRRDSPEKLHFSISVLAQCYLEIGNTEKALAYFDEAYDFYTQKIAFGNCSQYLASRAVALHRLDRSQEAMSSLAIANQLAMDDCWINLPSFEAAQITTLSANTNLPRSNAVSVALEANDPELVVQSLAIVMASKRLGTTYLRNRNWANQNDQKNTELKNIKSEYGRACEALVQAQLQGKKEEQLAILELEKSNAWLNLSKLSQKFSQKTPAVEQQLELLAGVVPEDTIVLEFVISGSGDYCFYAIEKKAGQKDLSIELVRLGDANAVNALIETRQSKIEEAINFKPGMLAMRGLKADADVKNKKSKLALDVKLDEMLWSKLRPIVSSKKKLVVCPVGKLDRLAWASLRDPATKQFLTQSHNLQITLAESARHYCELMKGSTSQGKVKLLAIGDVDYGKSRMVTFPPIPQSKNEAIAVANYFKQKNNEVQLIDGREFSASNFSKAIPGSSHIHVAAHGVALSELKSRSAKPNTDLSAKDQAVAKVEKKKELELQSYLHPLSDFSLALTDANVLDKKGAYSAAHFLTGEEIMQLDLRHVDLVALSTCYSGQGVLMGREGLFGVEKAFRLAGARSTLTSLTSLDDQSARLFVESFYESHIKEGLSKSDAFHAAQLHMIKLGVPPENWVSWQLIGDGS